MASPISQIAHFDEKKEPESKPHQLSDLGPLPGPFEMVLKCLCDQDILNLSLSSKEYHALLDDDNFWKNRLVEYFGPQALAEFGETEDEAILSTGYKMYQTYLKIFGRLTTEIGVFGPIAFPENTKFKHFIASVSYVFQWYADYSPNRAGKLFSIRFHLNEYLRQQDINFEMVENVINSIQNNKVKGWFLDFFLIKRFLAS
jgi:hypothetical protein